ncbi:MAG: hypothetical protein ACE10F_11960 [Candidatus Methylomirabilales bacterium]
MQTKQITATLSRARSRGDEAEVTITTPDVDLMGDRIFPLGMSTDSFLNGTGAINYAHDHHHRLPVAKTTALDISPNGIRAHFQWRSDAFSKEVKAAFDDGVLGASVEFVVSGGGAVPNETGGFDFRRTILTGLAFTGSPANPRAVKLLKSLRENVNAMNEDATREVVDLREEEKMFPDIDLSILTALVKKEIKTRVEKAISRPATTPAPNRAFREMDRRDRECRADAERRALTCRILAQVRGDAIIRRETDMALCPFPPPAIAVNLGDAIPEHLRYWPI